MSLRILLVDDYDDWKQYVTSKLQNDLRYRVVGQAADGPAALEAAERLEPDLILLDVGLPGLNGIEVAQRLRASHPQTRILFLSANQSPEIARAAVDTGAHGYVVKQDAATELLPAIAAIADGRVFVGPRFSDHRINTIDRSSERLRHHAVCFSLDDSSLVECFVPFAAESLMAGGSAIVAATRANRRAVYEALHAEVSALDAAVGEGRYVALDVDDLLSTFMVDGWPDEARFVTASSELITAAAAASRGPHPRVAACGEAAPQLWERGNAAAAVRLEQLWDGLAAESGVDILCGYSQRAIGSREQHTVEDLCAVHSSARWR